MNEVGTSDDTKKAMEKEGYSLLDDLKVIEKNKDILFICFCHLENSSMGGIICVYQS